MVMLSVSSVGLFCHSTSFSYHWHGMDIIITHLKNRGGDYRVVDSRLGSDFFGTLTLRP